MERRLHRTAMAQVLDALNVQRKAALLSLPLEASLSTSPACPAPPSPASRLLSSQLDTEKALMPFLRDAVVRALEPSPQARAGGKTTSEWPEVGTLMEGRRLVGIDLACTRLSGTFNRSDLSGADLTGAFADHSTFNLARMQGCSLAGAQFHSCTFLAADAAGVDARRGRFSQCVFCRANLIDWDVRGASFYRCVFTMSDLSRWVYDAQTTVMEPVDWGRCRRLDWTTPAAGCGDCRVVGKAGGALSLPPRAPPPLRS
ncbi:uncharacterized protein Tco025E_04015 [Trypanosoma conorhini]|uniref:Pentapeptide repeat-containing protein n=1 Tax=Trypanosoma conorhini TaxID=83891 RepID=A0A3R7P988_9TRYP|nr:uncharacterized protein Tco025E_04015 [Trypanosoma conorhini]RNF19640.1 hypothetical protein Tco025E_04015 [Trypanosoma conorhini]